MTPKPCSMDCWAHHDEMLADRARDEAELNGSMDQGQEMP